MAARGAAIVGALDPHFPFGLADYDWAFHLIAFSSLTALGAWMGWNTATVVLVVGSASVLIELSQSLVPTRSVSGRDVLMNAAGIGAGLLVVW